MNILKNILIALMTVLFGNSVFAVSAFAPPAVKNHEKCLKDGKKKATHCADILEKQISAKQVPEKPILQDIKTSAAPAEAMPEIPKEYLD